MDDEGGSRVEAAALGALLAALLGALLELGQVLPVVQLAHVTREARSVCETLRAEGAHVRRGEVRLLQVPLKPLLRVKDLQKFFHSLALTY